MGVGERSPSPAASATGGLPVRASMILGVEEDLGSLGP
jgi:hypothetical protein